MKHVENMRGSRVRATNMQYTGNVHYEKPYGLRKVCKIEAFFEIKINFELSNRWVQARPGIDTSDHARLKLLHAKFPLLGVYGVSFCAFFSHLLRHLLRASI